MTHPHIDHDKKHDLVAYHIRKIYGNRPVVRDVSIHVKRGQIVGLLGPNGAGKTTTFSAISGLTSPTSGKVYLDGMDITNFPMYRRARMGIGYLPQESSVFRSMSVADNISCVLEYVEPNAERRLDRLEQLLGEFSIDHLRNSKANTLSGGERRRVEIARALAASPKFLLFDEPLAGIDPIAVYDIRHLVHCLKAQDMGILITDHNVRDTLAIVDYAYIIAEGRILAQGKPDDIISDPEVRRVYLGQTFHS
ncbi:MAG: LPS export ABC transporter ATP-binding protein [Alphaproteobacteria bacterium]|nr:MAG: LPS export ABC transporter ATP-binding protein [Alphaproteobacteria bacterium]